MRGDGGRGRGMVRGERGGSEIRELECSRALGLASTGDFKDGAILFLFFKLFSLFITLDTVLSLKEKSIIKLIFRGTFEHKEFPIILEISSY
jgi:hypothetical protein